MLFTLVCFLAQTTPSNAVPFPVGDGSTVTSVGGITSKQVLENARNAGDYAASGLDRIWTELVSPDSPFYSGLIKGLAPLVMIGFVFWAGCWAQESIHQGFSRIPLHKVLWPLIVIIFLNGNGFLLASTTLVGKNIAYQLNDGVLNSTIQGIVVKQAIQQMNLGIAYRNYYQQQLQACNGKTGEEHELCVNKALAATNQLIDQTNAANTGLPEAAWWNPGAIFSQIKLAFEEWLVGILVSISLLFHWGFAFCLAIWGMTGPLWLSITLLPIPTKGVYTFVSGFFAFGLMIVSFSMILGAVAVSMAQAANGDPLLFPLIVGLLSPVLAFLIGTAGGIGLFVGLSRLATFVITGGK